jgi:exodeoxyribonuclease-3
MRLITWNINSVRLRAPLVHRLVNEIAPDVLCLQETKVIDELFPHDALAELFPHRHVRGMKAYNGVAILSRIPFTATGGRDWCGRLDARHASVTFAGGVELHDFYVPAGGDEPDPDINDKFAHKLQFLDEMTAWGDESSPADAKKILVGDLNIAPLEHDVWSHKQLLKVVSHTPVEVERLQALQASQDWVDAVRHFVPDTEKLFSWWSYRSRDWRESNRGRRLDHVWVTPALTKNLQSASVFDAARDWLKPSDHAPVVVDIDI